VLAPTTTPSCAFAAGGSESAAATVKPTSRLLFMKYDQFSVFAKNFVENVPAQCAFPAPLEFLAGTSSGP